MAVHSVTNEEKNVKFQEEIFSNRFGFMIKLKYALQHIDERNCESPNIFFNSDRKLLCLNFTNSQLSIPFVVLVTKNMKPKIYISIFYKYKTFAV